MGKTPVYRHVASCKQSLTIDHLKSMVGGHTLAVDASMWMHQIFGNQENGGLVYQYVVLGNCQLAVDAYMVKATTARDFGFHITHVFDGDSNPYKREEEESRAKKSLDAMKVIDPLKARHAPEEDYPILALMAAARRTSQFQQQLKYALQDQGFTVVQALQEADHQLAYCAQEDGSVWGVIQDDVDALVGAPHLATSYTMQLWVQCAGVGVSKGSCGVQVLAKGGCIGG